jgi:hypothetical protein
MSPEMRSPAGANRPRYQASSLGSAVTRSASQASSARSSTPSRSRRPSAWYSQIILSRRLPSGPSGEKKSSSLNGGIQ